MSNTSRSLTLFLRSAARMAAAHWRPVPIPLLHRVQKCCSSDYLPERRRGVRGVGGATISMRVSATNFSGRMEALLDGEAVEI